MKLKALMSRFDFVYGIMRFMKKCLSQKLKYLDIIKFSEIC